MVENGEIEEQWKWEEGGHRIDCEGWESSWWQGEDGCLWKEEEEKEKGRGRKELFPK